MARVPCDELKNPMTVPRLPTISMVTALSEMTKRKERGGRKEGTIKNLRSSINKTKSNKL